MFDDRDALSDKTKSPTDVNYVNRTEDMTKRYTSLVFTFNNNTFAYSVNQIKSFSEINLLCGTAYISSPVGRYTYIKSLVCSRMSEFTKSAKLMDRIPKISFKRDTSDNADN